MNENTNPGFLPFRMQSDQNDDEKPISCGFYRLEKGTPLVYEYTYHEMKIILEGEFEISDETGQKVKAGPGDVFYFPKGSKITFTTDSYGLAFYVGGSCWLYLISSTLPSQQLIIQFNYRLVSVKKVRHKGISDLVITHLYFCNCTFSRDGRTSHDGLL